MSVECLLEMSRGDTMYFSDCGGVVVVGFGSFVFWVAWKGVGLCVVLFCVGLNDR